VTPHSLRRTYASLRDDPVYIAEQLGHTDPGFTFRVYQRAVKRRERLSGPYRTEFDRSLEWASMAAAEGSQKALMGTSGALGSVSVEEGIEAEDAESA
jgi:hypothetical protein